MGARAPVITVALVAAAAAALWMLAASLAHTPSPTRSPAVPRTLAPTPTLAPARPHAPARPLAHALSPAPAALEHPGSLRHPITPEHIRLYRDVDLLDDAWQALQARDFSRARAALAQHAREYPSASDDLNQGLSILAACMEHPSAATRARAQRFYDEQTHSMARRRIRRECLERHPVH